MEEREVVGDTLEEFRERLERWDELCAQLRKLYYRYLDLAAFRSEKCYFPGRKCKRPWKREYDLGDLTLMWMYIANTAPLCGKLMRALAEVEYEIRKRALENLEKYGGTIKNSNVEDHEISHIRLKVPVYAYLVLWNDYLYVIWDDFNVKLRSEKLRSAEVERKVVDIIQNRRMGVDVYEIDKEYERLWLEVPLPEGVRKLLGGGDKAPVALFRNLGWLLSDDSRTTLAHDAGKPGQVALRLFDWIALVKYAVKRLGLSEDKPLVFRLAVRLITKTKKGENPVVHIRPIGFTTRVIRGIYSRFGIPFGKPRAVIARGYNVIGVLHDMAIRRHKVESVVDDVNSWIALSEVLATLIIGDGTICPYMIRISTKAVQEPTLDGETTLAKELAKALKTSYYWRKVVLWPSHMKLIVPAPPMPAFEKTVKLFKTLLEYPVAVLVEVSGTSYLLGFGGNGRFKVGGKKAAELYGLLKRVGIKARYDGRKLYVSFESLMALAQHNGFKVKFLNQLEKEAVKRVWSATSLPDFETLRQVFEKIAEVAKFYIKTYKKYRAIVIALVDKSKFEEVLKLFEAVGLRYSVYQKKKVIMIYEQRLIEAILKVAPHLFSKDPP